MDLLSYFVKPLVQDSGSIIPRPKNEIRISPDEMFNDSVDISTTFG